MILLYWFSYITRELAFDYVLDVKTRVKYDYGFLWKFLQRCIQMIVITAVTYVITIDIAKYYLSPGG